MAVPASSSGARTRTPNNWTRTSCVAYYTTPESGPGRLPARPTGPHTVDGAVEPHQPPISHDAPGRHGQRLTGHVAQLGGLALGRRPGRRGVTGEADLGGDVLGA